MKIAPFARRFAEIAVSGVAGSSTMRCIASGPAPGIRRFGSVGLGPRISTPCKLARWGLVAALATLGCQSTIHPRSARVAPAGDLGWDAHLTITRVAPARMAGTVTADGTTRRVTTSALSGGLADATAIWLPPLWFDGSVRYGLFAPCEVGGLLSPLRVGVEARCQLVDGPFDLSVAAAGAFLPFFDRNGLWGRAGFDLSRHLERHLLMSGVYVAAGPEGWWIEPVRAPDGVLDPADPTLSDGPSAGVRAVRDEVSLAVPIGLGFRSPTEGAVEAFVLGLVFRQVLDAGAPTFEACSGCARFAPDGLDLGFSVALTLGLQGAVF